MNTNTNEQCYRKNDLVYYRKNDQSETKRSKNEPENMFLNNSGIADSMYLDQNS